MITRFIALLAGAHAVAFLTAAAVFESTYLLGAGAFMVAVMGGAWVLSRRPRRAGRRDGAGRGPGA